MTVAEEWCIDMLTKEKNKLVLCDYVKNIDEINEVSKASLILWIDHCYNLNKPQSRKDIDNLIAKAFEKTNNVDKLIPSVIKDAIKRHLYSNLFLNWDVSYGTV